jgi:probable phosphoglycerate mutase
VTERSRPAGNTRLIVWRHGRTGWNAADRMQGQLDTELDETGRAQAAAAARRLAELGPDAMISSDLRRAADSAAALAELTGLAVRCEPRLRERYFGTWQGMLTSEVAAAHPEEYARWRAGQPVDGCGVEELDDLTKRVTAVFQEAVDLAPAGTVVIACHGGAAKYGAAAVLGWPVPMLPTIGPLGNCRWIELHADTVRGWRLAGYNLG